jgi:hypothetical protein
MDRLASIACQVQIKRPLSESQRAFTPGPLMRSTSTWLMQCGVADSLLTWLRVVSRVRGTLPASLSGRRCMLTSRYCLLRIRLSRFILI